uniref:Pre-rRNA-processing protein TSR1 homolog n=1 Tax=Glossina palpalis gambiensis TaxID=67801 RepID=A0A1B0B5G7_9MUSC
MIDLSLQQYIETKNELKTNFRKYKVPRTWTHRIEWFRINNNYEYCKHYLDIRQKSLEYIVMNYCDEVYVQVKCALANSPHIIFVYGLLQRENKMSVMNVVLKRTPDSEVRIESKERLIMQCGYRRFIVNPIFSQHTNGNKHKFERYFRPHTTICATVYAPIQFPPAPILAFKINLDSTLALVARGCLLSCNPNRIILKRVALSEVRMRINRKSAIIRYLFLANST